MRSKPEAWVPPQPQLQLQAKGWARLKGLRSWLNWLTPLSYRLPVGRQRVLGRTMLLLGDAKETHRVMADEAETHPKHPMTLWLLRPLIGRGVFSVNGEEWRQQRQWVDKALQQTSIRRVHPQMQAATRDAVAQLNAGEVDLEEVMTAFTADVIVRTILSIPVAQDDAAEIFRSFSRYQQRTVPALVLNLFGLPQGLFVPYLRHHARPIRKWLARHIQSRLRGQKPAQADLLQALIDTNAFSPQQLVDQVSVLFLAGHETSASALAMAGYLLSQDPARQQRVRQEVLEQTQSPATPEELRRLSFTQAVWKETLRLYPPLPFLPRQNQKEEVLAGAHCPMRSIVTVSPWVLQRHRSLWPQAESFNPERFLEPESAVLSNKHFCLLGLDRGAVLAPASLNRKGSYCSVSWCDTLKSCPVRDQHRNCKGGSPCAQPMGFMSA